MRSTKEIVVVGATRRTMALINKLRQSSEAVKLILIHDHSFWLDELMAVEAIGGAYGLDDIRLDLKAYAAAMELQFYQDRVVSILPNRKKLMTDAGRLLDYHAVVFDHTIDQGNLADDIPVAGHFYHRPGYRLLEIKNELETLIEINLGKKLELVILGGQHEGLMIALQMEELLQQRDYQDGWVITIIEKEPSLLSGLSSQASAYALKFCKMNDIKLITETEVQHIQTNRVVMDKGRTCSFDMVVRTYHWADNAYFERAGLLTDDQGRVLIDDKLQAEKGLGLFAFKNSGRIAGKKQAWMTIDEKKQVEIMAYNILAYLSHKPLKPVKPSGAATVFVPLGGPYAMISRGDKAVYGKWCLTLLHWMNKRFMKQLKTGIKTK